MILWLLQLAVAATPSFDCRRARTDIERTICASSELAALDREEARLYRLALAGPRAQRPRVVARQREFLSDRESCHESAAPLSDCLRDAYQGDIGELRRLFGLSRDAAGLSSGPVQFHCDGGYPDAFVTRFRTTPAQAYVTIPRLNEGQPLLAASARGGPLVGRYDTGQILEASGARLRLNARICTPAR